MPVSVIGVGGTGKAVVNILSFARELALCIGSPAAPVSMMVIDQDRDGIWPGVDSQPAVPQLGGTFGAWLQLREWRSESAARAFFSETELEIDMARGFHQCPRVATVVTRSIPQYALHGNTVQVLIYSAIGGTGAGVGPTVLRQLLAMQQARHVIAVVLGRYLDYGPSAALAFNWLRTDATLTVARNNRWFTGRAVNVPALRPRRTEPPASGLNEHPVLAEVADFVWQICTADHTVGVDTFLGTAGRTTREDVQFVPDTPWADSAKSVRREDNQSITSKAWRAARAADLAPVIGRHGHLARAVNELIDRDDLSREVWNVFSAADPVGLASDTTVNSDAEFATMFAAVPDELSAAESFHEAVVAEPTGTVADVFRHLLSAYMSGQVTVYNTGWELRDSGVVYALTLGRFDPDVDDVRTEFGRRTIGFFTPNLPPWTTAPFARNLARIAGVPHRAAVTPTLRIDESTNVGALVRDAGGNVRLPPSAANPSGFALQSVAPGHGWKWSFYVGANSWEQFRSTIAGVGLLARSLETNAGSVELGVSPSLYRCSIRGVHIVEPLIAAIDCIRYGDVTGSQYYDISAGAAAATDVVRVVRTSEATREAHVVTAGALSVSVGNMNVELNEVYP